MTLKQRRPLPGNPVAATALPVDHAMIGWTFDPAVCSGNTAMTAGTLHLARIDLRAPARISKLLIGVTGAIGAAQAGQNWAGLYLPNGTRIARESADTAFTNIGARVVTLTSPVETSAPWVWLGVVANASSLPLPQLLRGAGFAAQFNANLAEAASYRWCSNGTGLTDLPSSITPGSNSLNSAIGFWAGLA